MSAIRNGWQAERFVTGLLTPKVGLVVQLGAGAPADILTLDFDGRPTFWEVKGSRVLTRARKARLRLSNEEAMMAEWCLEHDIPYHVVQVWTKPDGTCELVPPYPLSISPSPAGPE